MLHLEGLSDTEKRILRSALELFVEQGYFATSIPQIVRRAQVSTGSIYHHFGDKRHLAEKLLERLVRGIDHQIRAVTRPHADQPRKAITALIRWMLQAADEQPALISFVLYARHREFLPDAPPICTREPFEHMRALVAAAQRAGELPPMDPVVMSAQVFGPTFRIVQAAVDGILPQPAQTYAPALIDALSNPRR